MGWPRWGGLAYDGAISFNGVSFGISFVLDKDGCSMLVRPSGSTPSLDHSLDGISIGISLDHTLVISFWYVLLVEPSSCNLHEGTLVFLIRGGFTNHSPRLVMYSDRPSVREKVEACQLPESRPKPTPGLDLLIRLPYFGKKTGKIKMKYENEHETNTHAAALGAGAAAAAAAAVATTDKTVATTKAAAEAAEASLVISCSYSW